MRRWSTGDSIPMLPGTGFEAITTSPAPQSVIACSTWRPGCPVGRRDLAWIQNPYLRGDVVLPELASAYLDRDWLRPGMITPDGPAVRAFSSIGWEWGGDWSATKDYQHFSVNGR
ncbi:MAG TPA: M15 family metallopeptidase [Nocardioidaceae bacterium]